MTKKSKNGKKSRKNPPTRRRLTVSFGAREGESAGAEIGIALGGHVGESASVEALEAVGQRGMAPEQPIGKKVVYPPGQGFRALTERWTRDRVERVVELLHKQDRKSLVKYL